MVAIIQDMVFTMVTLVTIQAMVFITVKVVITRAMGIITVTQGTIPVTDFTTATEPITDNKVPSKNIHRSSSRLFQNGGFFSAYFYGQPNWYVPLKDIIEVWLIKSFTSKS